eukprot:sb/3471588/
MEQSDEPFSVFSLCEGTRPGMPNVLSLYSLCRQLYYRLQPTERIQRKVHHFYCAEQTDCVAWQVYSLFQAIMVPFLADFIKPPQINLYKVVLKSLKVSNTISLYQNYATEKQPIDLPDLPNLPNLPDLPVYSTSTHSTDPFSLVVPRGHLNPENILILSGLQNTSRLIALCSNIMLNFPAL